MKRRDFLKSVSGLAAGAALPAVPQVISSAKADARSETLLIVSEGGPTISTSTASAPTCPAMKCPGIATTG